MGRGPISRRRGTAPANRALTPVCRRREFVAGVPCGVPEVGFRAVSLAGHDARKIDLGANRKGFYEAQYESDVRTSPPRMEFRPIQTTGLIVLLMKWTEPSPKPALTPPGWRLREPR